MTNIVNNPKTKILIHIITMVSIPIAFWINGSGFVFAFHGVMGYAVALFVVYISNNVKLDNYSEKPINIYGDKE